VKERSPQTDLNWNGNVVTKIMKPAGLGFNIHFTYLFFRNNCMHGSLLTVTIVHQTFQKTFSPFYIYQTSLDEACFNGLWFKMHGARSIILLAIPGRTTNHVHERKKKRAV